MNKTLLPQKLLLLILLSTAESVVNANFHSRVQLVLTSAEESVGNPNFQYRRVCL